MSIAFVEPLERRVLLSAEAFSDDGILFIRGDDTGNQIDISFTREGVQVILDGQRELFQQPIHAIDINAGNGDNIVRYHQLLVADIALSILTGDGEDEVEILFDLIDAGRGPQDKPAPNGWFVNKPTVVIHAQADTGAGADRVKVQFSWLSDSAGQQFTPHLDFTADINPGIDSGFNPETGDEVIVAFEHGDIRRPIIIGAAWNSNDPPAVEPSPRLGLRNLAAGLNSGSDGIDSHFHLTGGDGNDDFDLNADYSNIRLQQGAVLLDADLNGGDNSANVYIITSARHLFESNITAGDGDNTIVLNVERKLLAHELTHVVQQRRTAASVSSDITLGDGDNILQVNVTDFDFVHHRARLGNGDNQIGHIATHALGHAALNFLDEYIDSGIANLDIGAGNGNNSIFVGIEGYGRIDAVLTAGDGDNAVIYRRVAKVDSFTWKQAIVIGDGNNLLLFESELGDRGDDTYDINLGNGNNHTEIRFGDGAHGRRLPAVQRNVTATYRSGAGNDTVEIHGSVGAFVAADFTLDLGGGQNSAIARWNFENAWPHKAASGPKHTNGYIKLHVMGGSANNVHLNITAAALDDETSKPMEIVVVGSEIREAGIELELTGGPSPASRWGTVRLHDVTVAGDFTVMIDSGNATHLSYYQDRLTTESFLATASVQLRGGDRNDVILASLDVICGDGSFQFLADGRAGNDFIAVLARALRTGDLGEVWFEVLGGEGDDVLALAVLADTVRAGSVFARLDGGTGINRCFTTSNVLIENCDHDHDIGDALLLRLLRRQLAGADVVNSKEYTDEWSTAV